MKKQLFATLGMLGLGTVAILLSTSEVFASRARLSVMGDADPFGLAPHGSLYYDDNYNHIYNPSFAADFKNWAAIEKGNDQTGFYPLGDDQDQTGTEGGFVASIMNLNVGAFFNRDEGIGLGYGAAPVIIRPIDFTVAGDFGFKWGLGYTFAGSSKAANGDTAKENIVRVGFQVAGFEPWGSFRFASNQRIAGTTTSHTGFSIGTRYRFGEWIPYAAYGSRKAGNLKDYGWGIGLARNARVAEGVSLNYAVAFWRGQDENAGGTDKISVVPISLSVEGDVATWLTARAGLGYDLINREDGSTQAGTANGRLGATFHIGKVNFDWGIGSAQPGTNLDNNSFSLAEGFFTDASLTYRW